MHFFYASVAIDRAYCPLSRCACSSALVTMQVQDGSDPGNKVKAFYRLMDLPVIMVVDPITGAALRTWVGAMDANR
jgi:hypothetical protein